MLKDFYVLFLAANLFALQKRNKKKMKSRIENTFALISGEIEAEELAEVSAHPVGVKVACENFVA
jgi:hypothetical protein